MKSSDPEPGARSSFRAYDRTCEEIRSSISAGDRIVISFNP